MGQENAMSDTRGGGSGASFSKVVQKHAGRAKEKILQNLGKADKTTDEVFDEYEANFTRQQTNANRLHKEVANYLRCARMLHGASKTLFDTLSEVYEPEWAGNDLLYAQAQNSDMLWTDFVHKLQDQSLAPLTAYQIQFPELRKKIDKRGRKLVDYDSQRHQLEALQRNNRRDEYKLARCRDQLELARTTYDGLNKELYEELPSVYDQRVSRTAETLQTLYAAESTFMRESSKIAQEMEAISDKLVKESASGKYRINRGTPITPRPISYPAEASSPPAGASASPQAQSGREEVGRPYEEIQFEEGTKVNGTGPQPTKIPAGATTTGLASGVLYQVRTTYKYEREDVDELTFDVGEIINVVEYEDPEEQEEGWLCGYKVSSNEKGLFPANFTRPI